MKKVMLALLIAAGTLGTASTADAGRYYYGPRYYGGYRGAYYDGYRAGYYGRAYYRPYNYGYARPYYYGGTYAPGYYGAYYPYGYYSGGGVTYYGPNVGVTVGW